MSSPRPAMSPSACVAGSTCAGLGERPVRSTRRRPGFLPAIGRAVLGDASKQRDALRRSLRRVAWSHRYRVAASSQSSRGSLGRRPSHPSPPRPTATVGRSAVKRRATIVVRPWPGWAMPVVVRTGHCCPGHRRGVAWRHRLWRRPIAELRTGCNPTFGRRPPAWTPPNCATALAAAKRPRRPWRSA